MTSSTPLVSLTGNSSVFDVTALEAPIISADYPATSQTSLLRFLLPTIRTNIKRTLQAQHHQKYDNRLRRFQKHCLEQYQTKAGKSRNRLLYIFHPLRNIDTKRLSRMPGTN